MGYTVDLLTFARNVCKSKEELLDVAHGLRVPLNPDALNYVNNVTLRGPVLQVRARMGARHRTCSVASPRVSCARSPADGAPAC